MAPSSPRHAGPHRHAPGPAQQTQPGCQVPPAHGLDEPTSTSGILASLAARLPARVDVRLVVTDMDGTLLDGDGRLPARLPQVLDRLREAGIMFCPASGRQMANLHQTFGHVLGQWPVIAENGTFAALGGGEYYSNTLSRAQVERVIGTVRQLAASGADVGTVVATAECAWMERADARFVEQVGIYYTENRVVDDLLDLPLDDVVKVAVHDFGEAETSSYPALAKSSPDLQTVVSGLHWTDLMAPDASKGLALAAIQRRAGITPAQTVVFGDFLNDVALFEHADLGFAMSNAHPRLREIAPYVAPSHTDDGVLRVVDLLLDRLAR